MTNMSMAMTARTQAFTLKIPKRILIEMKTETDTEKINKARIASKLLN